VFPKKGLSHWEAGANNGYMYLNRPKGLASEKITLEIEIACTYHHNVDGTASQEISVVSTTSTVSFSLIMLAIIILIRGLAVSASM
jgi:hypothetical protein